MRLNQECVRSVLLTLEEINTPVRPTMLNDLLDSPGLTDYSEDDVIYTVQTLIYANFIDAKPLRTFDSIDYMIYSITWEGHQFLDTIRDEKVWRETKNVAKTFTSASLEILSKIATEVMVGLIKKQL